MNTETKPDTVSPSPLPKWMQWYTRYCRRIAERDGDKSFTDEELAQAFKARRKEHYSKWFNRFDKVLSYPRFLLHWAIFVGVWLSLTKADWFYCLPISFFAASLADWCITILLSPLSILFWIIDHRYPIAERFRRAVTGILIFVVLSSFSLGIVWFLLVHHAGNPGNLSDVLTSADSTANSFLWR
jgi:hypothetical protein